VDLAADTDDVGGDGLCSVQHENTFDEGADASSI
jgi:hypothetical protein